MASLWRPGVLGLGASALVACATPGNPAPPTQGAAGCAPGQRLAVGATCSLMVDARSRHVPLPIAIEVGDRYLFEVPDGQGWADWSREVVNPRAGDAGSWLMNLLGRCRRLPGERWMVMGLTTSACLATQPCEVAHQRVGAEGVEIEVTRPTALGFFANDIPALNWNNRGEVLVSVRRLAP